MGKHDVKLNTIMRSNHWPDVEAVFLSEYPDQHESMDGYRKVFENLLCLNAEDNDTFLIIEPVHDAETGTLDYSNVCGKEANQASNLSLEFMSWAKWLGMTVAKETLQRYNELEIIAHCMFEMTFMGFDEVNIQDELSKLNESIQELKSMNEDERKANTRSIDELFKEMEDE